MRSDEFIDLYKQLEDELEVKFSTAKQRRYSSVVFEYINHYESAPCARDVESLPEIRNLMTHNANLGGEPIVEPKRAGGGSTAGGARLRLPSAACTSTLRTKGSIRCARLSSRVLNLMESMDKSGFSHIPVIEKEKFLGVFSVSTIFSCILRDPTLRITKETTLSQLGKNAGRRKSTWKTMICR